MQIPKTDSEEPVFPKPGKLGKLKQQMYSRFKQPIEHPRRVLSPLERTVPQDWEGIQKNNDDSQYAEPVVSEDSTFEITEDVRKKHSLSIIFLIISILIFVVVGVGATVYILMGSNTVMSRKIAITINGPNTVDSGAAVPLQITVQNNNSAALERSDLVITYPSGTRNPSDPSTALESQRISLGSIQPSRTRNGVLKALLFGKVGELKKISVVLEYRIKGSSGLFSTKPMPYSVKLASSAINLSLASNAKAITGQPFSMVLTVTSNTKTVLKNVLLKTSYPFGFSVSTTTPETVKEGLWNLGDMAPGDVKVITITGKIDGQAGDARVFKFTAGTSNNTDLEKVAIVLATFEKNIIVERPFLGMSLAYAGKSAKGYIAKTGKNIPIILSWRNNLSVALSDVVIMAKLSGTGLDPFKVKVQDGFYQSNNSVVVWDKNTTRGKLAHIAPGATGTLLLQITPKVASRLLSVIDPTITIALKAGGQRLSEAKVSTTIQSTVKEDVRVSSNVLLVGKALYFGNPLGSIGPLPPKIGNKTTYGIVWELANSTSVLQGGKVTAVLPPYVQWSGSTSPSSEQIMFNPSDRTVTWYVGKVLSQTGIMGNPPRRVVFNIGFTPSASQIGKTPVLIQNESFAAVEPFTSTTVQARMSDLTVGLLEAKFVEPYGIVVQ